MNFFPMFLRMTDRDVVIVGGGETAAQKARLVMKSRARVTVIAPVLCAELAHKRDEGLITHKVAPPSEESFKGAALVFVATDDAAYDAKVYEKVRAAGALVNVVDRPDLCEANTPSIVDRRPVVVAIGTEGTAPILGRQIKTRMEELLEPGLGRFARLAGHLRDDVAKSVPDDLRRPFWRWVFAGAPRRLFASGQEREAAELIGEAIGNGAPPEGIVEGLLSLVPYGSRCADLMTLRAVQRLQEADFIIHRSGDAPLLELARRDAQRFEMPDAMNASKRAIDEMADGARVVWLIPQDQLADADKLLSCRYETVPCVVT